MLGAVVGDAIGSVYERHKWLPRTSPLITPGMRFTDDTLFTLAVADALLARHPICDSFRRWGAKYPVVGASQQFSDWLCTPLAPAYQGDTNGSLMRVSPAVALARDQSQALRQAREVTEVSHDHPRALAAVDAYAHALWAAIAGAPLQLVLDAMRVADDSGPDLEELHAAGEFRMKADQTLWDVRQCLQDAHSFESVMRNCIYCGGDVDTLCAVAGALAEPLWGIPDHLVERATAALPKELHDVLVAEYSALAKLRPAEWAQRRFNVDKQR
jgi:ADP-ribosyl-[dinitrogen reductase] hydrolase